MEDFYYAGGLPVVLKRLGEAGCCTGMRITVNGQTIWANVADAVNYNPEVIRPADECR